MTLVAILFVTANLCFPMPASPDDGFACLKHWFAWYEGEPHKFDPITEPTMHWRDIEVVRVEIPAMKPAPR